MERANEIPQRPSRSNNLFLLGGGGGEPIVSAPRWLRERSPPRLALCSRFGRRLRLRWWHISEPKTGGRRVISLRATISSARAGG
jgi:hypothetical protein